MPKKNPPDPNELAQSERFKRFAREVGADTDKEALDRTIRRVADKPRDHS